MYGKPLTHGWGKSCPRAEKESRKGKEQQDVRHEYPCYSLLWGQMLLEEHCGRIIKIS